MKRRYRNTAFLVELLLNILVFSISCAVLAGLFGKAGELSAATREAGFAATETQRLIEVVKARGAAGLAGAETLGDGTLVCRYNGDWQETSGEGAAYEVRLTLREEATGAGVLLYLNAVARTAAGKELYTLQTAAYRPNEGGGAA